MQRRHYRRTSALISRAGTFERLESRQMLANTLQFAGGGGDEHLRLSLNSAGNVVELWNDSDTARGGPISSAALGSLSAIYITGGEGDDRLTIDTSNGLITLAGGIHYDGGSGFDDLVITQNTGPVRDSVTYAPGPSTGGGRHTISGQGATQTIIFDNLEPVVDTVAATTLTVLGTNASNVISYTASTTAGQGRVAVDNFEIIDFANKTNLAIDAGLGDDIINLGCNITPTGLTGVISVDGGDPQASDTLIVNGNNGILDNLRYSPVALGAGTVFNDAAPQPNVQFLDVEHLKLVVQAFDGDGFRVDGTAGNDTWEFTVGSVAQTVLLTGVMDSNNVTGGGPFALCDTTLIGGAYANNDVDLNFFGASGGTDRVILNGTSGDDAFTVTGGQTGGTELDADVGGLRGITIEAFNLAGIRVRGYDGADTLQLNSDAPNLSGGVRFEGGTTDGDAVSYVGSGAGTMNVNLLAATVSQSGHSTLFFTGVESLTALAGIAGVDFVGSGGDDRVVATDAGGGYALQVVSPGIATTVSGQGQISINGLDGTNNTLTVVGRVGLLDNIRYVPSRTGAGTILADSSGSPNIVFSNIASVRINVQANDGDGVRFDGTTGNDTIEYTTGVAAGTGTFTGMMDQNNATGNGPFLMTPLSFDGGLPSTNDLDTNFFNPGGTDTFIFNATAGDDDIAIHSGEAGGVGIRSDIGSLNFAVVEVFNTSNFRIRGGDGDDTFTIENNLPVVGGGITIEGGDPSASDRIAFAGTGSNQVSIDLLNGTIQETTRTLFRFTGIELLTATAGGGGLDFIGTALADTLGVSLSGNTFTLSDDAAVKVSATTTGAVSVLSNLGDDSLRIVGTPNDDVILVNGSSGNSGTVTLNGLPGITYNGLEHLTVDGIDGSDTFTYSGDSFDTTLIGGVGADTFGLDGFLGNVRIRGDAGVDRIRFVAADERVIFNLDLLNSPQRPTSNSQTVTLTDSIENFTGSNFDDILRVNAAAIHHDLDGDDDATSNPGDTLIFDGQGRITINDRTDPNTGTIRTAGYADTDYDDFETITILNNAADSGFDSASAYSTADIYSFGRTTNPGKGPAAVATGDLNGDGRIDMVVVNTRARSVGILINRGDGSFFDPFFLATGGSQPRDVLVGEFDTVPGLDIVVSNPGSRSISFIRGNNDGTFAAPVISATPKFRPYALASGDMDGDGDLDVVATSIATSGIQVLKNNASGAFASTTIVKTIGRSPVDVVVADINDDGELDAATANSASRSVSFFSGSASGALGAASLFTVGSTPRGLAVGDLNNDGRLDLAVSNRNSAFVSVLAGVGNAGGDQFNPQVRVGVPGLHKSSSIVLTDVNGDGNLDIALGNTASSTMSILRGMGQNAFLPAVEFALGKLPVRRISQAIAFDDFNDDGLPDFVVTTLNFNDASVLLRNV